MQLALKFEADTRISTIHNVLLQHYGPQRDPERCNPIIQLFRAIISSRTKDADSDEAFCRLCEFLPSWDALADSDTRVIAQHISLVLFAETKARHLVATAGILRSRLGCFDLSFLADWPVDAAMAWLRRLPGVGPKVAAATLNFSTFRKRVFVADTHIIRQAKRLGLVPRNASDERAFRILMRLMPEGSDADDLYELHWLIKMHGQTTCRHAWPACEACVLAQYCDFFHSIHSSHPNSC